MPIERRIKAKAIWIDPEDKTRFEYAVLDLKKKTGKMQTHESTFKHILDFYIEKNGGVKK